MVCSAIAIRNSSNNHWQRSTIRQRAAPWIAGVGPSLIMRAPGSAKRRGRARESGRGLAGAARLWSSIRPLRLAREKARAAVRATATRSDGMDTPSRRDPPAPALDDAAYDDLVRLLYDRLAVHAPGWANFNESDQGAQLVALFAFLTESLLGRANALSEHGRLSASRLAEFALALANPDGGAAPCALQRPRYFLGQVLGAGDFTLEQDYFRRRLRRLNLELHGSGVVRGLEASVQPSPSGAEEAVVVMPGFALTPSEEEVEICDAQTVSLPNDGRLLYVLLFHAETPTRPEPAANGEGVQFTRTEDGFSIRLAADVADDAVPLARLLRGPFLWRIDDAFTPRRATSPRWPT